MRLSTERIQSLQRLLKEEFDLDYDHEQAQQAGLAIMRFVVSKHRRNAMLKRSNDGNRELGSKEFTKTNTSNTNN